MSRCGWSRCPARSTIAVDTSISRCRRLTSCATLGRGLCGGLRWRWPARVRRPVAVKSFQDLAIRLYGSAIASWFLLGYSEKLWGLPCSRLSPAVAGRRINGLGVRTFLIEALLGRRSKTRHLDGAFYYPIEGYGAIAERLGIACGEQNIRLARA